MSIVIGPSINNDVELIMNDIRSQIPSSRVIGLPSADDLNSFYGTTTLFFLTSMCLRH
jgi:hypothetical protein